MSKKLATRDKFNLTDKQELFVEAFIGECEFDPIGAYKAAGYSSQSMIYSQAMKTLNSEAVRRAIHQRMNSSTFWISEGVIIDRLFKEAMSASNPSARINALVWVGKHIGMWKDKDEKEEGGVTYNIVNYGASEKEMKKVIDAEPGVEKIQENTTLPEGVTVLQFNEPKGAK